METTTVKYGLRNKTTQALAYLNITKNPENARYCNENSVNFSKFEHGEWADLFLVDTKGLSPKIGRL